MKQKILWSTVMRQIKDWNVCSCKEARILVPLIGDVRTIIMDEEYATRYSIHPGSDKMYYDLSDMYCWPDYNMEKLSRLYIDETGARHEVLVLIISDRDGRFSSQFCQSLQKALGTRLDMSMAYHPQTDGQSKKNERSMILIVKVHWNSTRGPEDFMKAKYPHLFVKQVIDGSTS
ncbi:reverse transcriptase domain-containing protein [Tanacetum coccineum]